jgi:hypothetical protein
MGGAVRQQDLHQKVRNSTNNYPADASSAESESVLDTLRRLAAARQARTAAGNQMAPAREMKCRPFTDRIGTRA